MAWNYEKGCEEPNPYSYNYSGPYSSPQWDSNILCEAREWEMAEIKVAIARTLRSTTPGSLQVAIDGAIFACTKLESKMLWEDNLKIDEFRRKYMEWLAREGKLSHDIGLSYVHEDQLPLMERIIAVGYRQLAKTTHPDLGGSTEDFNNLKEAKNQLILVLGTVKDVL